MTEILDENYVLVMLRIYGKIKTSSSFLVLFEIRTHPYHGVEVECPEIMGEKIYNNDLNYSVVSFPNLR